jgi:hypothetical protein
MTKVDLNYMGLIFDCPIGTELTNCSFSQVRKIKDKERLVYYETLSNEERDSMVSKHRRCLSSRENKTLFHKSQ